MEKELLNQEIKNEILEIAHYLLKFPKKIIWIDYDEEADVLYINFNRPQKATDSEMTNDGILLRYKDEELVGITILDASKKQTEKI